MVIVISCSMVVSGYKKALETSDLWDLNERDHSDHVVPIFMKHLNKELEKRAK